MPSLHEPGILICFKGIQFQRCWQTCIIMKQYTIRCENEMTYTLTIRSMSQPFRSVKQLISPHTVTLRSPYLPPSLMQGSANFLFSKLLYARTKSHILVFLSGGTRNSLKPARVSRIFPGMLWLTNLDNLCRSDSSLNGVQILTFKG